MRKEASCKICSASGAKYVVLYFVYLVSVRYAFRCCEGNFCSMDCFKGHTDCSGNSVGDLNKQQTIVEPNWRSDRAEMDVFAEDPVPETILREIALDPTVQTILSKESLQMLLRKLNGSRDRRRMFAKLYDGGDSDFRRLVDAVAVTLGVGID